MKKINFRKGFTLIELLVVVAIIGLLSTIVLVALNDSRKKTADASIKSNLRTAISQAEIFYNTNTAVPNSYTGVCTNPGPVGGVNTISAHLTAAVKVVGLANYTRNGTGTLTTATCNDSASTWAAEVPLKTSGQMWCVDSTGKSKQESVTIGAGTSCA